MIEAIEGVIAEKNRDRVIVNVNGVYFGIFATKNLLSSLPAIGEISRITTYFYFKEDYVELIGFSNELEKEFFKILISIQGIGPKNAVNILSSAPIENFKNAILTENTRYLSSLPGIGPKTAKRLIVELKDKVKEFNVQSTPVETLSDEYNVALTGLINLGCTPAEATELLNFVVRQSPDKKFSAEELITNALKIRGSR